MMKRICIVLVSMLSIIITGCNHRLSDMGEYNFFTDQVSRWAPEADQKTSFVFVDDEWVPKEPPLLWSQEYFDNNHALDQHWKVSLEDNEIIITTLSNTENTKMYFDVKGGRFIGENHGEWGGSLKFSRGLSSYYVLRSCNPVGMFVLENDLYLLEGISHLMIFDGNIYRIHYNGKRWEVDDNETYTLKASPKEFVLSENAAYVVTDTTITKIQKDDGRLSIEVLLEADFLELGTSSIVKKDNILFLGMCGAILTFNLGTDETQWLVQK